MTTHPVLVTGATGNQGGAVARALLDAGRPVRALVRDPSSEAAVRLAAAGATLVRGDLDDPASLKEAAAGATAVFSMETANFANLMADFEVQRARNLVTVSREAGIEQIVHFSVSGTGTDDPGAFDEERWGAGSKPPETRAGAPASRAGGASCPAWSWTTPAKPWPDCSGSATPEPTPPPTTSPSWTRPWPSSPTPTATAPTCSSAPTAPEQPKHSCTTYAPCASVASTRSSRSGIPSPSRSAARSGHCPKPRPAT
ncbi:hypothetical protein TPA0910_70980 [Streptomyces hygroscopicus subsp. sporocinereus]|uniref:NmrA-like domain-containing protein n=1 Tax=Streptomyces hygroscopicus TaxID=1912 RepID=A0ABQ3UAN3_STRHY|nr:hypothetical protein TPA0910_70980 [Streptomyces hygroscopicus]